MPQQQHPQHPQHPQQQPMEQILNTYSRLIEIGSDGDRALMTISQVMNYHRPTAPNNCPSKIHFNVVGIIEKVIGLRLTLFDEENPNFQVTLVLPPALRKSAQRIVGQKLVATNPDLLRGNIVCVRRLSSPKKGGQRFVSMADLIIINPFLRDQDGPIRGGKRVTRAELRRIVQLTDHLTARLTSPVAPQYTRDTFEIVDLFGVVLAKRAIQSGPAPRTELFLRLPYSTACPPFFAYHASCPVVVGLIAEYLRKEAPQQQQLRATTTITPALVNRLIAERRLLVVTLYDDHHRWAQQGGEVRAGRTVVLLGVHARDDRLSPRHKVYRLHGGQPGQRRLLLDGSIFDNKIHRSIEACFKERTELPPPPPPPPPAPVNKIAQQQQQEQPGDDHEFEFLFNDDFEEQLEAAGLHLPVPKRQKTLLQQQQQQLKKEEEEDEEEESNDSTVTRLEVPPNLAAFTQLKERAEVENQAAGSSPLRLLKIPTEPGQPIVHFFHREEEVMIIGVAGVAQLAEQFRRKAEQQQQQQASSSTTSRRKELFYRLKGCTIVDYFFGDEEEEEGEGEGNSNVHGRPRRRLANLMALRRHCVLLFCTRASCHFITVFESVSEALKRCQQRELHGSEENNPATTSTTTAAKVFLRCPLCHLGTLKPNLWVRVVLEDGTQGTQRQRMTALISSPLSNVLFNADEQQLLTGPAGSTGLPTAVERTMARLCPQRGGGGGGGLGGGGLGGELRGDETEEEKATTVVDSRRPPRFTLVLRPALVDSPQPENLSPVQSLFNEGLLGGQNRTLFNVVGLYTADDAGDGDDHDKQPL